jgi:hypothetical protein
MPDHPTDRQLGALVDGTLDHGSVAELQAHLNGCPRCRYRIDQAQPAVELPALSEFPYLTVALPSDDRERTPTVGDIWRLSWDDETALGVIWDVEPDRIRVLPVVDVGDADEWALLLGPADSSLGTDIAVSVALATAVPWAVLDAAIAAVADTTNLTELMRAFKQGTTANVPTGDPVLQPADERLVELEEVGDMFARFANIPWPPSVEATAAAADFDTLLSILGDIERALAISNRGARPTDTEADLIEAATGQRPTGAPLDPDVIQVIDRPKWKPTVRRRAAARHVGEADARRQLADEAGPALVAARGTYGGKVDPEVVLERFFGDEPA